MQVLYSRCAGFDVHKDSVMVCLLIDRAPPIVRQFATTTAELLRLRDFLIEHRIKHVAMESTGVYWKPIWNLLEDAFELMLVNAQHVKQVPGRKTDVSDCQWIADLLRHGLVRASFVPPSPQRDLRELTRQRGQLIAERARVANRIQKVLEDANIKLGSVVARRPGQEQPGDAVGADRTTRRRPGDAGRAPGGAGAAARTRSPGSRRR